MTCNVEDVVKICNHYVGDKPMGTLCVCAYARKHFSEPPKPKEQPAPMPEYVQPPTPVSPEPVADLEDKPVTANQNIITTIHVPRLSSIIEDVDDFLWGLV